MRIVAFIGSPIDIDEKELVKLAKRLKKEKVNVDVISFGEESVNNEVLTAFVNALNGKDGTGSHLVTVPPGPHLSDALISSPIIQGEDGMGVTGIGGAGYEFGVDPNEDPELALVSLFCCTLLKIFLKIITVDLWYLSEISCISRPNFMHTRTICIGLARLHGRATAATRGRGASRTSERYSREQTARDYKRNS